MPKDDTVVEGWEKSRVCYSEDTPEAEKGYCPPPDRTHFDYKEIRTSLPE